MLHLLSKIILIAGLFAHAEEPLQCEKGQIRSVTSGKVTVTDFKYCYDKATKSQLFSPNCRSKKCVAFDYPEELRFKEFIGPTGSPGFKVCRKVGGIPQIVEFSVSGKWYKLDQCVFQDGSFVNSDYLAHYYFHLKKLEPLQ